MVKIVLKPKLARFSKLPKVEEAVQEDVDITEDTGDDTLNIDMPTILLKDWSLFTFDAMLTMPMIQKGPSIRSKIRSNSIFKSTLS